MFRTIAPLALAALAAGCAQPLHGPHGDGQRMAGMHAIQIGPDNTPGWTMMTPQEREEHQRKMMAARSPAECQAMAEQHQREMAGRAKGSGMPMDSPKHDMCAMMQ
jgi:hypothetical protein